MRIFRKDHQLGEPPPLDPVFPFLPMMKRIQLLVTCDGACREWHPSVNFFDITAYEKATTKWRIAC